MTEIVEAQEPFDHTITKDIQPLKDAVLVTDMEYGEQMTQGGIIRLHDDGKNEGIRPRWCTVHSVGSDVTEVKVGERILVAHARWTRGVKIMANSKNEKIVRMVDTEEILLIQD